MIDLRQYDVFLAGINFDVPGEGGPDCFEFISYTQRITETTFLILMCAGLMSWAWNRIPKMERKPRSQRVDSARFQYLLAAQTAVFGVQVGFKLYSRHAIFLLNVCHVLTMVQIFILTQPHSVAARYLYRLQMFWLIGPVFGCLFPAVHTLTIPGEVTTFWLQHALLLVVPACLALDQGPSYLVPWSPAWAVMAYGIIGLYHLVVLQPVGLITHVNVGQVLCPAVSDPFGDSKYFRLIHTALSMILVPLVGKVYVTICHLLLRYFY